DGRIQIEFNPNKPKGRLRYSIAHELAHTLFPDRAEAVRKWDHRFTRTFRHGQDSSCFRLRWVKPGINSAVSRSGSRTCWAAIRWVDCCRTSATDRLSRGEAWC